MSDSVMLRLTGWSTARLAEWRQSLQPEAQERLHRQKAELLRLQLGMSNAVELKVTFVAHPKTVGGNLVVSFDQLSPNEQRKWRALEKNPMLTPQDRSEAMKWNNQTALDFARGIAEVDAALAAARAGSQPAQGRLFTDAELDESIPERLKHPGWYRRS